MIVAMPSIQEFKCPLPAILSTHCRLCPALLVPPANAIFSALVVLIYLDQILQNYIILNQKCHICLLL